MGNKILTVCLGNICRSPVAEGFFAYHFRRHQIPGEVSSAGIQAVINSAADPFSQKIMQDHYQIDISAHRARQFDEKMARYYDLILVMEDFQATKIQSLYPYTTGKIHPLGKWRKRTVADPYQQSEQIFQQNIALIHDCVNDWIEQLWQVPIQKGSIK